MIKINKSTDALLIVDIQNDFCPGGALAVPEGDKIVPVVNALIPLFASIYTTQDWHPANHISFKPYGGVWPPHCIADTKGAALHPLLEAKDAIHILKGTKVNLEAYSGFQGTNLRRLLKKAAVKRLFITGLATDYCVRATALDALADHFDVVLVTDAIMGVDVSPGDSKKALLEMKKSGVFLASSKDISQVMIDSSPPLSK
jgi:nicotinamidase/pyrazinamidase